MASSPPKTALKIVFGAMTLGKEGNVDTCYTGDVTACMHVIHVATTAAQKIP